MDGPEEEEDDEEVVCPPEAFVVSPPRFLDRCEQNGHQGEKHDITRPAWPCHEVDFQESHYPKSLLHSQYGKVGPVSSGVYPCEEDYAVGNKLVEVDVLVEGYDAIEGSLAE